MSDEVEIESEVCDLETLEEVKIAEEESTPAGEDAQSEQLVDGDDTEGEQVSIEREELPALIEAIVFVHGTPISKRRLSAVSGFSIEDVQAALDELRIELLDRGSGIELLEVAEGFQLRTRPRFAAAIRNLRLGRPRKLSQAALETLAIVAYRQPIVKSDIEAIRGVDTSPTLKTLLERKLIKIAGHQASPGQPALYGTTDGFLEVFGLGSLGELPTLRDLREISAEPGEADIEPMESEASPTEDENALGGESNVERSSPAEISG